MRKVQRVSVTLKGHLASRSFKFKTLREAKEFKKIVELFDHVDSVLIFDGNEIYDTLQDALREIILEQ